MWIVGRPVRNAEIDEFQCIQSSGKFFQLCVAWRSARPARGLAEKARTEGWRLLTGRCCTWEGQIENELDMYQIQRYLSLPGRCSTYWSWARPRSIKSFGKRVLAGSLRRGLELGPVFLPSYGREREKLLARSGDRD